MMRKLTSALLLTAIMTLGSALSLVTTAQGGDSAESAGPVTLIGGAVMRVPFTVILLLLVLGNPSLLPVSALAAITSYLAASIRDAGSARRAMRQAVTERRDMYV